MPRPPSGEVVGTAVGDQRIEALALVGDFDDEPVGEQLVRDLDDTHVLVAVRVPDRVGRGLGQRQLEVREQLVGQLAEPPDARERKPAERDVLGPAQGSSAEP